MTENQPIQIQFQANALFNVPFDTYEEDFTFIVNNKEFKTSRIISDLISPTINHQHLIDPTNNIFIINTKHEGNFSYILNLIKSQQKTIPENECAFITEVLDILRSEYMKIILPKITVELSIDNVIDMLEIHSKKPSIFSEYIIDEINFISNHFYEIEEEEEEKLTKLDLLTITRIFDNPMLQLRDENQLLKTVNKLYSIDQQYSILYERIYFNNVDETEMSAFINTFDYNDMTGGIWKTISTRLEIKIEKNELSKSLTKHHYKQQKCKEQRNCLTFVNNDDKEFDGIISHLRKESNNDIQNLLSVTASSIYSTSYSPYNVCLFDKHDKFYQSNNEKNSWICFDFKKHRIIPTSYIIRSSTYKQNSNHPKSWVVEGSNDNWKYEILDEINNNSELNGHCLVRKFNIANQINKEFRYIRIRQTSNNWSNWNNLYYFTIGSIEFFGTLI